MIGQTTISSTSCLSNVWGMEVRGQLVPPYFLIRSMGLERGTMRGSKLSGTLYNPLQTCEVR